MWRFPTFLPWFLRGCLTLGTVFFFQSLPIVTMHDYYWLLTINEWLLIDNTSMVSNCQFQGIQSRRIHDHFAETSFFTQLCAESAGANLKPFVWKVCKCCRTHFAVLVAEPHNRPFAIRCFLEPCPTSVTFEWKRRDWPMAATWRVLLAAKLPPLQVMTCHTIPLTGTTIGDVLTAGRMNSAGSTTCGGALCVALATSRPSRPWVADGSLCQMIQDMSPISPKPLRCTQA